MSLQDQTLPTLISYLLQKYGKSLPTGDSVPPEVVTFCEFCHKELESNRVVSLRHSVPGMGMQLNDGTLVIMHPVEETRPAGPVIPLSGGHVQRSTQAPDIQPL
jgi:hypothetical protein